MAVLKDLEVRVVASSNQDALQEYDDLKAVSPGDDLSIEKFIEATIGLEY